MRKLYLHIGFNKTGSTSLQSDLVKNAAALSDQGFFYPNDIDRPYFQRVQHVPLAAAAPGRKVPWLQPRKKETLNLAWPSLFEDIAKAGDKTLLLSSESFGEMMTLPQVRWLQQQLEAFETKIVAYIRRQDAYFLSTYQEGVKHTRIRPFSFVDFPKNKWLHFSTRLAPWREVFGAENVIVRPFDPHLWPDDTLLYDFLAQIGAGREGMTPSKPQNEGLDYRVIEFRRQLNMLNVDLPLPLRARLSHDYAKLIEATKHPKKMRLSADQIEILRDYFREDNAEALKGSGVAPDDFFPPPVHGQTARLAPNTLSAQALLQLIAQRT